jgi:hypothetical protein
MRVHGATEDEILLPLYTLTVLRPLTTLIAYGFRQQTEMALAGEIMTGCKSRMLVGIRVISKLVFDVTRAQCKHDTDDQNLETRFK